MFEYNGKKIDILTKRFLKNNYDIGKNIEIYEDIYWAYFSSQKLYSKMNKNDKNKFEEKIAEWGYFNWLGITKEKINYNNGINKEKVFDSICKFIDGNNFCGFLSDIENEIVNSYRDSKDNTKVLLDSKIRNKNTQFINKLDGYFKNKTVKAIELFFKPSNYMKMKF